MKNQSGDKPGTAAVGNDHKDDNKTSSYSASYPLRTCIDMQVFRG